MTAATWARKASLWTQFNDFLAKHRLQIDDTAAALFAMTRPTIPNRLSCATGTRTIIRQLGWGSTPTLDLTIQGLTKLRAALPIKQAVPIRPDEMERIIRRAPPRWKTPLRIAWKTASRWDEIHRLQRKQILHSSRKEIIICWANRTKSSGADPFRAARYTVITGRWTKDIHQALKHLTPEQHICPYTTPGLRKMLGPPYGAHSIKRGGALQQAATIILQHSLDPGLLPLLAKHKSPNEMVGTTIRYADGTSLARLLGTQKVTQFL